MDISPYYIDARNAITQPDKMVFLSQYFRRSWMPALGPLGTAIVIYLRGACYHNRKSGETRDTVQIAQREIAAGCGCSVPTIKRELERNEALRRFVRISPEWERDGASGRVRQLENHYKVAMDDPLTEADETRLQEMVRERSAQEQQGRLGPGGGTRKPIRLKEAPQPTPTGLTACSKAGLASLHDAVLSEGSNAVNDAVNTARSNAVSPQGEKAASIETKIAPKPVAQNELLRPVAHFESTPVQNELLYIESLLKTTKEQTLNVAEGCSVAQPEGEGLAGRKNRNLLDEGIEKEAGAIVEEFRDWGSERRYRQLLSVCERNGLSHLTREALSATRNRLACEGRRGAVGKPGAYFCRILVKLLQDHQVFVPVAGEDDPAEVSRLARMSLMLAPEE